MSSAIAVITDSSSTIKTNEIQDVFVVPMVVIVDDSKTYKDGIEIDSKQLLEMITPSGRFSFRKTSSAKTSMPAPQDFIDTLNQVATKYDLVVCLPLSSGLSGTLGAWQTLVGQSPLNQHKNVVVLETNDTAISLRWLVEDVLALGRSGSSVEAIKKYVSNWANRIECAVVLENLDQLVKGGRIRKIQAMVSSLLKIRPVIRFHHKNDFLFRAFSVKSAIEKVIESFAKSLNIKSFDEIEKVGFSSNILQEENQKSVVCELLHCLQVFFKKEVDVIKTKLFTSPAPAVISAHTGVDSFSIQLLRK